MVLKLEHTSYLAQRPGWVNRFRRPLIRWEKKAGNYLSLLYFACAIICWKKFEVERQVVGYSLIIESNSSNHATNAMSAELSESFHRNVSPDSAPITGGCHPRRCAEPICDGAGVEPKSLTGGRKCLQCVCHYHYPLELPDRGEQTFQ